MKSADSPLLLTARTLRRPATNPWSHLVDGVLGVHRWLRRRVEHRQRVPVLPRLRVQVCMTQSTVPEQCGASICCVTPLALCSHHTRCNVIVDTPANTRCSAGTVYAAHPAVCTTTNAADS